MPEKFEVTLPWPSRALSPNSRGHWSKKAKAAEIYRYTCKVMTREAMQKGQWDLQPLKDLVEAGGQLHVSIDFYPPNRRPRDDDNLIAAFKSGRDGVADAIGIDDKHFRIHPFLNRDVIANPGEVRVVISGKGPEA